MPINLGDMAYAEYKRALKRAEEALRNGAVPEAASAYRQCAELYRQYANSANDPALRHQRLEKAELYQDKAQALEKTGKLDSTGSPSRSTPSRQSQPQVTSEQAVDDYEAEVLALIQQTSIRWEDIGGLDDTKAAIKSAYGMALARKPKGVEISSWRNVLLYGPPGTGKTLLAAATAGSLDANFFNVKVSNLLSKYFGESSKLITALYATARRLSPAVIFLDEFESLTPPRGSGESGAERRIVSTLLAELDGLATKEDESFVLTMGATNVPWLLDSAILSRFQRRIYVPLPDPAARKAILSIHLTRRGHKTVGSMEELVRQTEGFAGREIEQICQMAVARMTQRANPDLLAVVDQGQEAVRNYQIRVEPLNGEDFKVAFDQIRPIATPAMLQRYSEWVKKTEA
jgi:katanin p60 ATPase-containing subunit A1